MITRCGIDLLTILVPAVATVLTTLITTIAEVVKARRKKAPETTPQPDPSTDSHKTRPLYRNPIIISAFASAIISLSVVFIFRTTLLPTNPEVIPTPRPAPTLKVLLLGKHFDGPQDAPPQGDPFSRSFLDVPPRTTTEGTTEFVYGYNRYVWLFVCKQIQQGEILCTKSEMKLGSNGGWSRFVNIGESQDDCEVFEVDFTVVAKNTHDLLKAVPRVAKHPDDLEEVGYEFLLHKWLEIRRGLDKNHRSIPCDDEDAVVVAE